MKFRSKYIDLFTKEQKLKLQEEFGFLNGLRVPTEYISPDKENTNIFDLGIMDTWLDKKLSVGILEEALKEGEN